MPSSFASQLTPRNVIIMQIKPMMLMTEAGRFLKRRMVMEWRYMVKTVHVMSDHVSIVPNSKTCPMRR